MSTTSERVTHLHIHVPAITRGTLARIHELKMTVLSISKVNMIMNYQKEKVAKHQSCNKNTGSSVCRSVYSVSSIHNRRKPQFLETLS